MDCFLSSISVCLYRQSHWVNLRPTSFSSTSSQYAQSAEYPRLRDPTIAQSVISALNNMIIIAHGSMGALGRGMSSDSISFWWCYVLGWSSAVFSHSLGYSMAGSPISNSSLRTPGRQWGLWFLSSTSSLLSYLCSPFSTSSTFSWLTCAWTKRHSKGSRRQERSQSSYRL